MTSLYETLKASKIGAGAAPDMFTALRAQSLKPAYINSWADVRKIVRAGKAAELLPLGTYYNVWGDEASKKIDIVAYDKHFDPTLTARGYTHSITLCEHDLSETVQFDAPEAFLYLEQELPAGTYRFTLPEGYDATYGGGKTYVFTFPVATPAGGQLVYTWAYQQMPSKMASYASSTSVTALNNVNLSEWDGEMAAVDLGAAKLRMSDADSTYGRLNNVKRVRYGSNNYYQSGIRQFLNSDGAGSAWWKPTNIFDRPYGQRSSAGKLTQLSADLKSVLATPEIEYITCNDFEYGGIDDTPFGLQTPYKISSDKIFLLSHTEVNLSSAPNVGTVLDAYAGAGNEDRIKKRTSNNSAYSWWLRIPYPSNASSERGVNTSGALYNNSAGNAYGAPAACIIQ